MSESGGGVLRGALGFGAGGLLVAWAEWLVAHHASPSAALPLHYVLAAYAAAGVMGALVLTWGSGIAPLRTAGFGCGFLGASLAVMLTTLSLQAAHFPEYLWGAAGCGIGFALGGGVGGLALGKGWTLARAAALSFGLAGTLWGPLLFWHFWARKGALVQAPWDVVGVLVLAFPFVLGGALLGRSLDRIGLILLLALAPILPG